MITLRKITADNIWDVVKLSVYDSQKDFVATNTESLLEAYVTEGTGNVAMPFAAYADKTLVGFVMVGFFNTLEEEDPPCALHNYNIWRLMVDKSYQKKGYGREILQSAVDFVRTMPCGKADACWLSYEPENMVGKKLYHSLGFIENGQMCGEEIVAILPLH